MPTPLPIPRPVAVEPSGLVRVEGIPLCQVVRHHGQTYLRVQDRNRWRTAARGAPYVEVSLALFCECVKEGPQKGP